MFDVETKSEKVIKNIIEQKFTDVLEGLCKKSGNNVIIDYIYFKHFATKETYDLITQIICSKIDEVLRENDLFNVHINMKTLSLTEIDKHKSFLYYFSEHMKIRYPNKLEKCIIYNSSYIFIQIYNIVGMFVDKETLSKIQLN